MHIRVSLWLGYRIAACSVEVGGVSWQETEMEMVGGTYLDPYRLFLSYFRFLFLFLFLFPFRFLNSKNYEPQGS